MVLEPREEGQALVFRPSAEQAFSEVEMEVLAPLGVMALAGFEYELKMRIREACSQTACAAVVNVGVKAEHRGSQKRNVVRATFLCRSPVCPLEEGPGGSGDRKPRDAPPKAPKTRMQAERVSATL